MINDPTFMSEARQRVKIADVFGSAVKEEAETPLPRPLQDAFRTASVNGYGPLVHSTITGNALTLNFRNGKRATWRPDRRFLVAAYGSPQLAEVVERHGWADRLQLSKLLAPNGLPAALGLLPRWQ